MIKTVKKLTAVQKMFVENAAQELAQEYQTQYLGLDKNSEGYYIELTSGYYVVITDGSDYEFLADADQLAFEQIITEEMYDELISGSGKIN